MHLNALQPVLQSNQHQANCPSLLVFLLQLCTVSKQKAGQRILHFSVRGIRITVGITQATARAVQGAVGITQATARVAQVAVGITQATARAVQGAVGITQATARAVQGAVGIIPKPFSNKLPLFI